MGWDGVDYDPIPDYAHDEPENWHGGRRMIRRTRCKCDPPGACPGPDDCPYTDGQAADKETEE